jgi:hypothetical protein
VTQGACPIKVLEYMAAARPLLASNMPIVRELVREDVDGLLFSPNDPEDLARQAIALLSDFELSKRLAGSACERARTKFTWHESQKKLGKVYETLLILDKPCPLEIKITPRHWRVVFLPGLVKQVFYACAKFFNLEGFCQIRVCTRAVSNNFTVLIVQGCDNEDGRALENRNGAQ